MNIVKFEQKKKVKQPDAGNIFGKTSDLPIHAFKNDLIRSVKNFSTTVVVGETGSGKSTQLPQFLLDTGLYKCVVCTQPRRVAAVTVAKRVAEERNGTIGQEVGYSIRFEDCTSKKTKLKFVTDGVLLREFMNDRDLNRYSVIILDEAHERSLQTDIIMGLLKQLQQRRPDIKIVVMSATLDIDLFSNFFEDTNVLSIPGRQYPVEIFYTKIEEKDVIEAILLSCLQIHNDESDNGAVLVFLPGQDDIEALQHLLMEHLPNIISKLNHRVNTNTTQIELQNSDKTMLVNKNNVQNVLYQPNAHASSENNPKNKKKVELLDNDFVITPLYAAMPPEEQLKVFIPTSKSKRKFILATNIAETSITVTDVRYVIDCGFVKTRLIHPVTGYEMLKTIPISKAQANQRAGRSGRTGPGKCYRIYTEKIFLKFDDVTMPEIQRVNMTQVILQLKDIGIPSITDFPLPSPPSISSIKVAFQTLLMLKALDEQQMLTKHGKNMAQLPLFPILAHLLLKSIEYQCVSECLTAVSLLSSDNIFQQPFKEDEKQKAERARRNFMVREGDLLTLVNVYEKWKEAHMDKGWTHRNYLNLRSLQHAQSVRTQLGALLQAKLHVDISVSCMPKKEPFLMCIAAGLFMNVARKVTAETATEECAINPSDSASKVAKSRFEAILEASKANKYKSSNSNSLTTAPYKTLKDGQYVHIHPSSVLFSFTGGISKLPNYIIFAELLITSKQYVRTLSVIDESWLHIVAPHVYADVKNNINTSSNTIVKHDKRKNKDSNDDYEMNKKKKLLNSIA